MQLFGVLVAKGLLFSAAVNNVSQIHVISQAL